MKFGALFLFIALAGLGDARATNCPASAILQRRATQTVRTLVDQISRRPGHWSCDFGSCIPLTIQIAEALEEFGIPGIQRVLVSQNPRGIPGAPPWVYHAFVSIPAPFVGDEIIVDPTYRQFLHETTGLPYIFVGTRADLIDVFARYTRVDFDNLTELSPEGDYDPGVYVEALYGFGFSPASARLPLLNQGH